MSNSNEKDQGPGEHRFETGQRFDAYAVVERDGKKPVWVKSGAAWLNKDGSIQVRLDTLPLQGVMNLRLPKSAQEGGRG